MNQKKSLKGLIAAVFTALAISVLGLAVVNPSVAQLIYGNTFPFWNVNGPLAVTGVSTLSGGQTISGTSTISGVVNGSGTWTLTGINSIRGTLTGDSAAGGAMGEYLQTTVLSSAGIATATATAKDFMSQILTAGDWDVRANCDYNLSGVTATIYSCGFSTTSGVMPSWAGDGLNIGPDPLAQQAATFGTTITGAYSQNINPTRVTLSTPTTIFLVLKNTFSAGILTGFGTISARRVR